MRLLRKDDNGQPYWQEVDIESVRVVLDHLIDIAKTKGDSAAVEAMYAMEVEFGRWST